MRGIFIMKGLFKTFLFKYWKIILGAAYVVMPLDVIPDVLIPLGYTDDIIVILALVGSFYAQREARKRGHLGGNKDEIKFKKSSDDILEGEIVDE